MWEGGHVEYFLGGLSGSNLMVIALQAAAQEGDTAPPALEDVVDLHFVALVNQNDRLVELDGRKSFPIDHGKTTDSTLLQVRVFITLCALLRSVVCCSLASGAWTHLMLLLAMLIKRRVCSDCWFCYELHNCLCQLCTSCTNISASQIQLITQEIFD